METILSNLAQIQGSTVLAVGIMIGLAALGAGLGLAISREIARLLGGEAGTRAQRKAKIMTSSVAT